MQVTEWFPGAVLPVRKGWYEVGHSEKVHFNSRHFITGNRRFFDGNNWRAGWMMEDISIMGTHPSHQWRGFANKP